MAVNLWTKVSSDQEWKEYVNLHIWARLIEKPLEYPFLVVEIKCKSPFCGQPEFIFVDNQSINFK